jgi:hypothetical protein
MAREGARHYLWMDSSPRKETLVGSGIKLEVRRGTGSKQPFHGPFRCAVDLYGAAGEGRVAQGLEVRGDHFSPVCGNLLVVYHSVVDAW